MLIRCRYTYPAHGKVYVCADGPEVLVFSSNNDGPLWQYFADDLVVGVGVTSEDVFVIESSGRLVKMRLINGEFLDEERLDMSVVGLLISSDDVIAIVGSENLYVRPDGGEPMAVAISGATAVAFGPTGGALGLGTESGLFYAIDTTTGGAWGSVEFDNPVSSVAWCAQETWLVGVGHHIHSVSGDGSQILGSMDVGGMVEGLSCSSDGSAVAALTNGSHVRVFEWLNQTLAGNIWFQRTVQSIEFGQASWLLLAHEDGDANRVDLFTGQMTRTQAHAGRAQNAWPMQVEVNSALLRGASTTLKAGGAPIAIQVRSPDNEKKRASSLKWFVLLFLIGFVVCSASGALFCGLGPIIRGPKYYFGF